MRSSNPHKLNSDSIDNMYVICKVQGSNHDHQKKKKTEKFHVSILHYQSLNNTLFYYIILDGI